MTLTLVVVGLVLAPPTGWLLAAWLADLTYKSPENRTRLRAAARKPGAAGEGEFTSGSEVAISLSKDATSIPTGG